MTALSEQEKSRIYSEYQLTKNYRAVARNNGISDSTVRRIVRGLDHKDAPAGHAACSSEPLPAASCEAAKADNPAMSRTGYCGIDDFLKAKQPVIIGLINKYLAALSDDERIASATMPQIASAMSTLVEKLTVDIPDGNSENIDPLSQSFIELAAQLDAMKRQKSGEE